ncbi:MAG: DUF2089 domain-containing protein [Trueperaceae bacterium]
MKPNVKLLPMPTRCPITGGPLEVTRLESAHSGVVIEGRFQPNEFALLSQEHAELLRLFVKVRGNLKELERILGVSYPTVRLRFEGLLKALGYELQENEVKSERSSILELLEKGELTADEATKRLQAMRK